MRFLKSRRIHATVVHIRPLDDWYQPFPDVETLQFDLNLKEHCERFSTVCITSCETRRWESRNSEGRPRRWIGD